MTDEQTPDTPSQDWLHETEGKHPDLDPELLTETGRASAAQDMLDRGEALERTIIRGDLAKERRDNRRDSALITIALASVMLVFSQGLQQWRYYTESGPRAEQTAETVERIDEAFDDVEDVATFVRVLREQFCIAPTDPAMVSLCEALAEAHTE